MTRTNPINPTRDEDAVLDAFNVAVLALSTRTHGRGIRRAEMSSLGIVEFPGIDACVTTGDGIFDALVGHGDDAVSVYRGTLATSAVAAVLVSFANRMAQMAIDEAAAARG